jgi:hypothetical protein
MQDVAFESLLQPDRTGIDYLLSADFAEVVNGKTYIMGAGFDRFTPPSYPAPLRLGIAVGIRVPYLESNVPHHVVIAIRSGDGKDLVRIEADVETGRAPGSRGDSVLVPLAANTQVVVEGPQLVEITAQVGGSTRRISIRATDPRG